MVEVALCRPIAREDNSAPPWGGRGPRGGGAAEGQADLVPLLGQILPGWLSPLLFASDEDDATQLYLASRLDSKPQIPKSRSRATWGAPLHFAVSIVPIRS